ncbi:hypothetical protein FZEAL_3267 [Fusarium zealandicum]|uniref:Uncharacterized protein n=1 Tax=Fusarium zealandicum TaxID=1053134 RepID=A0A8H4XLZ6_9HYPO|nr:hypothetical protein FZEAL_3267 [Fusarium zealandicum]
MPVKTKSTSIPSVKELRKTLGFGQKMVARDRAFRNATQKHVAEFTTEDDVLGNRFTKWRQASHQKVLFKMAHTFLEANGLWYWPDGLDGATEQRYQFSKDYAQKSSSYALTSCHGPRADNSEPRQITSPSSANTVGSNNRDMDRLLSVIGLTRETAINVDDISSPRPENYGLSFLTKVESHLDQASPTLQNAESVPRQAGHTSRTPTEYIARADPYDDPHSPVQLGPLSSDREKRPTVTDPEESSHRVKVPRCSEEQLNETSPQLYQDDARLSLQEEALIGSSTSRVRQPVHRPGYITWEELDAEDTSREVRRDALIDRHGASVENAWPARVAPVAPMESVEGINTEGDMGDDFEGYVGRHIYGNIGPVVDVSLGHADADAGDAAEVYDGIQDDVGQHNTVWKESRSPTPGQIHNQEIIRQTRLHLGSIAQSEGEPNLHPEASFERDETVNQQEEQPPVETERTQSQPEDAPLEHETTQVQVKRDSSKKDVTRPMHAIDFTVYTDSGESEPGWRPPQYFLDISYQFLIEALPLRQPAGLSLCLEISVGLDEFPGDSGDVVFERTTRGQARFRSLQIRMGRIIGDARQRASEKGTVPNIEIIITPLK